jgi:O-acetylserine/cysteine efflux transporter
MQTKDKCLAALVILCWGLNFVAIKWGLEGIPPLLLGALRFVGNILQSVFV